MLRPSVVWCASSACVLVFLSVAVSMLDGFLLSETDNIDLCLWPSHGVLYRQTDRQTDRLMIPTAETHHKGVGEGNLYGFIRCFRGGRGIRNECNAPIYFVKTGLWRVRTYSYLHVLSLSVWVCAGDLNLIFLIP